MANNEARAALMQPGAIEDVSIEMAPAYCEVTVRVTLASEDLTKHFFAELRNSSQDGSSLRLGPMLLRSTFVDAEDDSHAEG